MSVNGITIKNNDGEIVPLQKNGYWTYTVDVDGRFPQLTRENDVQSIIESLEKDNELHIFDIVAISSWMATKEINEVYPYDKVDEKKVKCIMCRRKSGGDWSLVLTRAKRPDEHKLMGVGMNNQCYVPLLIYLDSNSNKIKSINLI